MFQSTVCDPVHSLIDVVTIVLDLSFHFKGAFVGEVSELLPKPTSPLEDGRSLVFKTFLAAPYISTNGIYKERKFCGSNGLDMDGDDIAQLIATFMHHVVVDSHGEYLLTDLQGQCLTMIQD